MIVFVGAVVIGATGAFFSDTETSTGNTFTAGAIDLTVDNESYVTNPKTGLLAASPNTSWTLSDLTGQLFFNFSDLKPGDIGEDTISLHVDSNDAWLCAAARVTDNSDQTCTEPELGDDSTCTSPGLSQGELGGRLNFAFWADDGDNVYEQGERIFLDGPISDIGAAGQIALADSVKNVWQQTGGGALPGGTTKYIGKAWCFGDLVAVGAIPGDGTPIARQTTGFTCSGEDVNNASQTDRVMGDIQFYAEQARNNSEFTCTSDYNPVYLGTRTLILENKDTSWNVIDETSGPEIQGTLTYNTAGNEFDYTFQATGLTSSIDYSLIYYADKDPRFSSWGGDNPGAVIGTFATDGSGSISTGALSTNLGMDLPQSPDWNISPVPDYCDDNNTYDDYNTCAGAKIWLVPTSNLTGGSSLPLVSWSPSTYLFETDLINYNDTND
ncbi:MAG: SipW-dependent-type signal peptide-containing protein [bacterium]|nr:SipW-dependent-type signal peptide-containing protein [bacterium]